LEILRETGESFTAPELARLVLEGMGKEPSELAISMLAKTIRSSVKATEKPVTVYDGALTWPGKMTLAAARLLSCIVSRLCLFSQVE
jgi:hypothetical protein